MSRGTDVLVVADDTTILAGIATALDGMRANAVIVSSGTEALRRLLKGDFALVVLDADLPGLKLAEVLGLLRQIRRARRVPVVALTTPGRPMEPAARSGLRGRIEKPLVAGALQALIAGLLPDDGSRRRERDRMSDDLQATIRERTSSLIRANDSLRREVARRERAEAALDAARRDAEAANAAKSEFLANMSHEIRTPMNGIVGLLELVLQTPLTAEQREYLNLVKVSAGGLLTIINDILDFSKIEAGSLELERTGFSLRETVGDTMKALAFEASRKDLELGCDIDEDLPDALLGDPVRLRQIITNLVGNAVKFTASGEVVLSVRRGTARDGEIACDFAVRDTGIGIPSGKLRAIFAPFFQGDTSTTRVYGGTGLGLTIAARLVQIMGGTIGVDSAVGEGSEFRFSLRFGPGGTDPAAFPACRGLRFLVAAHRVNRAPLVRDLKRCGIEVVETGDEAATAAQLRAGRAFDMVMLDDALPGLDVYELAAGIRRGAFAGARAVVVLSSIIGRQRHAAQIEAAGFQALAKPLKQSEILALASRVAGRDAPIAVAGAPLPRVPLPTFDILLVEDNPINSRLAYQVLSGAGHRVTTADNGAAALDALLRRSFDVVLMDVQMPGMDGIEATRLIRERERGDGGHVPIIALTAHAMAQHRARCLEAGMDGFLVKPIQPQDLLDAVAGLGAFDEAAPRGGAVERGALMERVGHDPRLLADVAQMLEEKGVRLMGEARQALLARNVAAATALAHTLTGMFASLAADRARRIAAGIEQHAAAERWLEAGDQFARLEWEVERLAAELSAMTRERPASERDRPGRALAGSSAEWNQPLRRPMHE